jgi:hypothetical protein
MENEYKILKTNKRANNFTSPNMSLATSAPDIMQHQQYFAVWRTLQPGGMQVISSK